MTTNLLAMPLLRINVETGNNEDWIDSIAYLVDPESDPPMQLDLRGIEFLMEVRRNPEAHEVVVAASTAEGTLAIAPPPNYGYLLINLPLDMMKHLTAGDYVADVRGTDDEFHRVVIQMNVTVIEGITK